MKRLARLTMGLLTVGALLSGCSENVENNGDEGEKNVVQESADESSEEDDDSENEDDNDNSDDNGGDNNDDNDNNDDD